MGEVLFYPTRATVKKDADGYVIVEKGRQRVAVKDRDEHVSVRRNLRKILQTIIALEKFQLEATDLDKVQVCTTQVGFPLNGKPDFESFFDGFFDGSGDQG